MDKYILEQTDNQTSAMHVEEGRIVFTEEQNIDELVRRNKRLQNMGDGYTKSRDMAKVADLDMVTYQRLKREGILKDKKRFMKWLDDPDNRHFRTNDMKLSRKTGINTNNGKIIIK